MYRRQTRSQNNETPEFENLPTPKNKETPTTHSPTSTIVETPSLSNDTLMKDTQESPIVVNLNKKFSEILQNNTLPTDTDELLKELIRSNYLISQQNETILNRITSLERKTDQRIEVIMDSMTKMKEELKQTIESQQFLDQKYEEQKTQISKLEAKVKSLCTDMSDKEITINQLKERLKLAEASFLSNKSSINALEQYGRREMINISGIPRTNNEDTDEIVFNITDQLGLDLYLDDIEVSHRTSSKDNAPIIVKFNSRRTRDEVWNLRYKLKNIKASDIGFDSNNSIYFNESLTEHNRSIFKTAWDNLKSPSHFERVTTENGITCVWKTFNKEHKSEKIIIRTKNDIFKLVPKGPNQNKNKSKK